MDDRDDGAARPTIRGRRRVPVLVTVWPEELESWRREAREQGVSLSTFCARRLGSADLPADYAEVPGDAA